MSLFKELIARDIHRTFLRTDLFADMHEVNGRMMPILIDDSARDEREKRFSDYTDGMYAADLLIYVAASDYGALPAYGSLVTFDSADYTVATAADEGGIYVIALTANRGRTNDGRLI